MQGGNIVLGGVVRIVYKLYIVLIYKIVKMFLKITYNNNDIIDAYIMKLFYLAFNHSFSKDLKQTFGSLECERNKS